MSLFASVLTPMLVYKPEYEAKQILFDCGNGYGLSVVTAKGHRFGNLFGAPEEGLGHGLYCENQEGLPTQYEVMPIKDLVKIGGELEYDYTFIPEHPILGYAEPKGWLYIEEIGQIAEAIAQEGIVAWPVWIAPYKEEEDVS